MARIGAQIVIGRPIAEVYDYVTDLRNDPKWWSGVTHSERVFGDGGVGTRYQLEAKLLGFKVPTQIDVTEADRPHGMTIVAGGRLPYVGWYAFTPTAEGTRIAISVEITR